MRTFRRGISAGSIPTPAPPLQVACGGGGSDTSGSGTGVRYDASSR